MGESRRIRVGDWTVAPAENVLRRGEESVRIKPRTMEVLVYLADHPGEVVSANELINHIWRGRIVGDNAVYQCITQLRHALGDNTETARFIETIPKRGYRLIPEVRDRHHPNVAVQIEIEQVVSDPQGTVLLDAEATAPARSRIARVTASIALVAAGAAIAGIVALSLRPEPATPTNDRWSHLTDGLFRHTWWPVIALSPDGRGFVYNTAEGLFFRGMDELEAQLIPGTEGPVSVLNPFFSPDGQSVAYFNLRQPTNGQLMRVARSGGAPIPITGAVTYPLGASWESNGTILYGQLEGIYNVPADGGTPELLIPADQGEVLYGPELLPDGDSVLFSSLGLPGTSWDQAQVVMQSLSSNERTVLVQGGSDARYVPTGHLVYAFGDGLYGAAFDLATRSVTGGAVSLVHGLRRAADRDDGGTAAANYGITDDGTLVYAGASNLDFRIAAHTPVWVDHTGQEESFGLEGCLCLNPSVSPDGTRLAFQEGNAQEGSAGVTATDIWVWSFTQGTRNRLSFEAGFQVGPVWSPDSQRVAYTSVGEGIFVRSANGIGTPELLLAGPAPVVWDWTVDDELIFTDGGDIGVIDLVSRERRPLFTTSFHEYRPAVSPDGRWIAYESNRTGQPEVFVRPYPDVDAGEWLVSSGGGQEPDWGPEGQALYFLGPGSMMEATVAVEGPAFAFEPPRPIFDRTRYLLPGIPPRSYAVSPDGQRFQMWIPDTTLADAHASGGEEIIVVRNWVEELVRRVPTN